MQTVFRKIKYLIMSLTLFVVMLQGITVYASNVSKAGDKKVLDVYITVTPEDMQPYKEMFETRYPDITVNYIYVDDYDNTVCKAIRSGDFADVMYIPSGLSSQEITQNFAALGLKGSLAQKYNYLEFSNTSGQMVYGIPSGAYVSGIIYNKSVFSKAGITDFPQSTEEFLEDLRYIRDYTDAIPFFTNYNAAWATGIWENYPFIDMTGNADYRYNTFVKIKNPYSPGSPHWTVYHLLYDIVKEGLCEEDLDAIHWEASKKMLNEGEIGCMALGSWAIKQIKDAGEFGENIGYMPFPNTVNGKQYATVSTDYNYGVNRNSEYVDEAKLYVDIMLNESGYALDNDCISIVKSDPYPDSFGELTDIVMLSWTSATAENNKMHNTFVNKLNLYAGTEQQRIIEAAAGIRKETFEGILNDWNQQWESVRPAGMETISHEEAITINSEANHQLEMKQYAFDMSETEWEYLASIDSLRIGYLRYNAPFQYEDEEHVFQGVTAQLWKIISEQTGIYTEYFAYDNYSQILEALSNGEIDVIAGIEDMESYGNDIRLSKEYFTYSNVIVKLDTVSMDSINEMQAAVVQGNERDYYKGLTNVVYGKTIEENIRQVEKAQADYTITNYYSGNYYINKDDYDDLSIIPITSKSTLHIGFAKDTDTRLIAICNKCIYALSDGNIEMMLLSAMDSGRDNISLKKIIKAYPLHCVGFLCVIFGMVISIMIWVSRVKAKNAKVHELDAKRYHILADLADEYVFEYSQASDSLSFDRKFEESFGFPKRISLKDISESEKGLHAFTKIFNELKQDEENTFKEFLYHHNNGSKIWYRMIVSKIIDNGKLVQIIGKVSNIQKEIDKRLELLDKTERDPLTGLYNRHGLSVMFERYNQPEDTESSYALAMIDFDDFKHVNDTLGHAGGDEALKLLAVNMLQVFGANSVSVRYGGDEFLVYLPNVKDMDTLKEKLMQLVQNMDCTMEYQGSSRKISISAGAILAGNNVAFQDAYEKADALLYEIKSEGKNNCRFAIF